MQALAAYLKKQSEQGSNASYYNIDILKYQVKAILLSMPLKSRHDIEILWERCFDYENIHLAIIHRFLPEFDFAGKNFLKISDVIKWLLILPCFLAIWLADHWAR